MNTTIKLYDNQPYETKFSATVISCEETKIKFSKNKEKTVYQTILDQTLFFPEEGGQSPDYGILGSANVIDVQIKNDIITHSLDKPLTPGDIVTGEIDWKHRFYNMQQHSGEHIFSGLVHNHFGYDNVGFHLSDSIVTMDFNGVLTKEQIAELELEANQVIINNIPIEISYPSKEELAEMDYRSKIEIDGQVRIVTIPDIDVCACCAPHVKTTGEIGLLKIMSSQNYKGGVRLSLLCGFRALTEFCTKNEIIQNLCEILSAKQESIVSEVSKLKSDNHDLKYQLSELASKGLSEKLQSIPADQNDVILFEGALENPVMRNGVNELISSHPGICGIFSGNDSDGYSFIIGSQNTDVRPIANLFREKTGAKGGGSAAMIQGKIIADKATICNLISQI